MFKYSIRILQQPQQGRMCGLGEGIAKRKVDPPLVLLVDLQTEVGTMMQKSSGQSTTSSALVGGDETESRTFDAQDMLLVCSLRLVDADDLEKDVSVLLPEIEPPQSTNERLESHRTLPCPVLLGSSVRSCIVKEVPLAFCLPHRTASSTSTLPFAGNNQTASTDTDTTYTLKPLFVFPDLCVRIRGKFRLKVAVVNLVQNHVDVTYTEPFTIYSPGTFPGILGKMLRKSQSLSEKI